MNPQIPDVKVHDPALPQELPLQGPEKTVLEDRTQETAQAQLQQQSSYSSWLPWNWSVPSFLSNPLGYADQEESRTPEYQEHEDLNLYSYITDNDEYKFIDTAQQTNDYAIGNLIAAAGNKIQEGVGNTLTRIKDKGQTWVSDRAHAWVNSTLDNFENSLNKKEVLDDAYSRISDAGEGPFVELSKFAAKLASNSMKDQLKGALAKTAEKDPAERGWTDQLLENISSREAFLSDLVEMNVANWFASLADRVANKKAAMNGKVSVMEVLLSTLSEDVLPLIDKEKFSSLELEFREFRQKHNALVHRIFPDIDSNEETQALLQQALKHSYSSEYELKQLFPEIAHLTEEDLEMLRNAEELETDELRLQASKLKDAEELLRSLITGNRRYTALQDMMRPIAEAILLAPLPNGFDDFIFPGKGLLNIGLVKNYVFGMGVDALTDVLLQFYEPLEDDGSRHQKWEGVLKERLGGNVDIQNFLKAPSAFAVAFASHFIQQDPRAISLLKELFIDKNALPGIETEINAMSQENLAVWLVQQTQSLLHTQNPELLQAAGLFEKGFELVLLSLLSSASTLALPEGEAVNPNLFIKNATESLIAKFRALQQGGNIPKEFWNDLIKELPFPAAVKKMIADQLIKKGESLEQAFGAINPDIVAIQNIYDQSIEKARTYRLGDQLIAISEALADPLFDAVVSQAVAFTKTPTAGNTLEDLFSQFFPGVKIDAQLLDWFKQNVSAFGEANQQTASVDMIKQAMRAIFLRGMVQMIDANFAGNEQAYLNEMFDHFQGALQRSIPDLTNAQKVELKNQLKNQMQIAKNKDRIEFLNQTIADVPGDLQIHLPESIPLVKEFLFLYSRSIRAGNYVKSLVTKKAALIAQLTAQSPIEWNNNRLSAIRVAFDVRKTLEGDIQKIKMDLKIKSEQHLLEVLRRVLAEKAPDSPDEIEKNRVLIECVDELITLHKMPEEQIKILTELLNVDKTIIQAQNEQAYLESEMANQVHVINHKRGEHAVNARAWETAKTWAAEAMQSYDEIDRLTQANTQLAEFLEVSFKGPLSLFPHLAREMMGLAGLRQKEDLGLPESIQSKVWPYVEQSKDLIAPILFAHMAPAMQLILEKEQNQRSIQEREGSDLFPRLFTALSKGALEILPDFVASYIPLAERFLALAGNQAVSPQDLAQAWQTAFIQKGKEQVNAKILKPIVRGYLPEYHSLNEIKNKIELARQEGKESVVRTLSAQADELKRALSAKEENFSQRLNQKIHEGMTPENLSELLREFDPEGKQVEKTVRSLHFNVMHALLQLGKQNIKTEDLMQAAGIQQHQAGFDEIAGKLKKIVWTPDEMAELGNAAIPGETQLQPFLVPQIQAFLTGNTPALNAARNMLESTIEGALLASYVHLMEQNPGQSLLEVIGNKLKTLVQNPALTANRTQEEAARAIVEELLDTVFGLKKDLPGIPPAMQKTVRSAIQTAAYDQLSPLLFPMIEKEAAKVHLNDISGSKFLGHLAEALAKDPFTLLPSLFGSLKPIGKELFNEIVGRDPSDQELDDFIKECVKIVQSDEQVTPQSFAGAYYASAQDKPTAEEFKALALRLDQGKDKKRLLELVKKFSSVIMTPEKIMKMAAADFPQLDESLQKDLAEGLQAATRGNNAAYQNLTAFAGAYIEGMALRFLTRIAEKNPPVDGKDSFFVMLEKFLQAAEVMYRESQGNDSMDAVLQRFNDHIFKEVFGIDSEKAFEGVPEQMKGDLYQAISQMIRDYALKVHAGAKLLEKDQPRITQAKEDLKRFGQTAAGEATAVILSEDIAKTVMDAVPFVLTQEGQQGMRIANFLHTAVEENLDQMARSNLETARLLLNYTKAPELKTMVGQTLTDASAPNAIVAGKAKAAELVNGLVLDNLNKVFTRVCDFEDQKGAAFNRKLVSNVCTVVGEHLKHYNAAKKQAKQAGKENFSFADYMAVAGPTLHPAVPVKAISYDRSVAAINQILGGSLNDEQKARLQKELAEMMASELKGDFVLTQKVLLFKIGAIRGEQISKELKQRFLSFSMDGQSIRDIIREEGRAHIKQRQEKFFEPASHNLAKLLFPGGKKDLDFIPEELRGPVLKNLKKTILPAVMSSITESLLDEATIKGVVVGILKSTEASLSKEFVYAEPPPPENPALDTLDQASGLLIAEMVDLFELPSMIKNRIKDPETGEVSPAMAQTLGAILRNQFKGDFIKETLKSTLESAVKRDDQGKPTIRFTPLTDAKKAAKREQDIAGYDAEMKRLVPTVADLGVAYAIESTWKTAQAKFDNLIKKAFGNIGLKLKKALDAVFNFVFFKIIGSILSFLFVQTGLKELMRRKFHDILALEENRQRVVDLLVKMPEDQPINLHAIHNEDLAFKIGGMVQATIAEALGG